MLPAKEWWYLSSKAGLAAEILRRRNCELGGCVLARPKELDVRYDSLIYNR